MSRFHERSLPEISRTAEIDVTIEDRSRGLMADKRGVAELPLLGKRKSFVIFTRDSEPLTLGELEL
jgi:hypothetical protein